MNDNLKRSEMECEFSENEKSTEEEAELQRSTKKPKDAKGASEFGSPPSYRDKLIGEMPGAFAQAFNLVNHEMDMSTPPVCMNELVNGMVAVNLDPVTSVEGHLWKPSGKKSPMMRATRN